MKSYFKTMFVGCFLFVLTCFLIPAHVDAYGITQTGIAKNSITIAWEAEERATAYHVYVGTESSNATLYCDLTPQQTTVTVTGLPTGARRYISVKYDRPNYDGTSTYLYTVGTLYDAVTLPGQVTGLGQERWYYFIKSFDAKWDKVDSASGYEYIVKNNKGKKISSGKIGYYSNPRFSVSKISNSVVYTAQVRAFTEFNGKTYYGDWSKTAYFFTQPRITSIKASKKKLVIKWGKVAGATGYDVYVSTKPGKGFKKVKSVKAGVSSVTIKKFAKKKISPKKAYYVYIATKKKVGKITYNSGRLYYWNSKKGPGAFQYFN